MGSLAFQVIQGSLLLTIIILAYKALQVIMDARVSKKFILKGLMQKEDHPQNTEVQSSHIGRMFSIKKYKQHLEAQLNDAHLGISANRFIFQKAIFSGSILFLFMTGYWISHNSVFAYLAIPLAIGAYILPTRTIKKHKQQYIYQLKQELLEYRFSFSVLLKSHVPFEALKLSIDYAGPLLKPHVEDLISQITLYPSSHKPFEDFANNVGLRETKEFMVALEQIMKVDAKAAQQIIQDQIQIATELQEEAYAEQVEARPDEVERYINPMLFPFVGILFTFIFILIGNAFSNI